MTNCWNLGFSFGFARPQFMALLKWSMMVLIKGWIMLDQWGHCMCLGSNLWSLSQFDLFLHGTFRLVSMVPLCSIAKTRTWFRHERPKRGAIDSIWLSQAELETVQRECEVEQDIVVDFQISGRFQDQAMNRHGAWPRCDVRRSYCRPNWAFRGWTTAYAWGRGDDLGVPAL